MNDVRGPPARASSSPPANDLARGQPRARRPVLGQAASAPAQPSGVEARPPLAAGRGFTGATPHPGGGRERLDFEGRAYPPGSWGHFVCVERGLRPLLTDPDTPVVRAFARALAAEGGDPTPEMMHGWGDIEFLATDHGVPAIYFGPGDVKAAHTADEYLELDKYHLAVRVYERAIPAFLAAAAAKGTAARSRG